MKEESERGPRSTLFLAAIAALALFLFAGFIALGTWQVERRAWKLGLIARVDQRVHAPAVDAPSADRWARLDAASDEYRHVRLSGRFLHDRATFVQASTELGSGFWVLTPMQTSDGIVLVNRGFVTPEDRGRASGAGEVSTGESTVTGLLRMSEPGGGFPRRNDPAVDRWYSRDIGAIAAARGLKGVAPYFVDADAATGGRRSGEPVGGLTVLAFHNNHLVYAITWYALALMVAVAAWYVGRVERQLRMRRAGP